MKLKSVLQVALLACILVSTAHADEGYPRTIIDSAGREVEIKMPVERIIVQNGGAARALMALDAADKVVGVADFIPKNPELYPLLTDKQVVGTWKSFDYELVGEIAKRGDTITPDIIVLCYYYKGMSFSIDSFEKGFAPFENITLIALDFTNPENLTDSLYKLGVILGKEEKAREINEWRQKQIELVKSAVEGQPMPRVYIESGASKGLGELTAFGPESGMGTLVKIAGGDNIAGSLGEVFPKVSWEWVVSQNPDVILVWYSADSVGWEPSPSEDTVELERKLNEVLDRPGGASISAVNAERVFLCHSMMLSGLENVVGLAYIAKLLHPDADLDPHEIWEEYQRITGLDYPDDRIFVYPEVPK
ncbi:MAG: ABC transporter substrate-binding protein [Methanothrix sp.]|jgi:ABC-type Fe3+-hydroxamate transport system, periplasmic component|uniref:Periplasmic binding protein n=1 Tax=Methanothrix thermoacetophila (strain DSM 6194 / JCM 14653 / NBRC 101360 / PT) TaxID=349307 RepID=A0B6A3_METTP|nr:MULTISPECIES: ABC transporter substrate-binding protein [Methanothrix]ABK14227.1 periplasmic binding protein [Methanothrix thermoacetophila PT]MBC7079674.1 ABC transporter substrate-binding protein [Methanothrix sp.]NPU87748.1 ABC transporter substrate-binding protein [Methanothrix sp.]